MLPPLPAQCTPTGLLRVIPPHHPKLIRETSASTPEKAAVGKTKCITAAIIKYPKLTGLDKRNSVLWFWKTDVQNQGVSRDWLPLRAVKEASIPGLS